MAKTKLMLLTIAVSLLAAAPAPAAYDVRVGIGDQSPAMFDHPDFKRLRIKRVRYFIPWNAIRKPDEMQRATDYVNAARRARVSVFMHVSSDDLRRKKARLPSKRRYRRDVTRLVRHFRALGVREWGSRNEANHDSQATWRSPSRAAWEFKVVRRACKRCTVVGLDVLDQRGVDRYIARYFRALGSYRRYVRTVGIHNYSDVNRRRTTGTRTIIRAVRRHVPRAKFWLTETGGIVRLSSSWPYSQRRAASRLSYMFRVVRRYRHHISRLYVYNWTGAPRGARFDAGLVNPDGSRRPGYRVVARNIRRYKR
ncbi:MAG TPA: hypothetical protein VGW75_18500 [Solirubrobacteraceae bacterium]|jgi:hypothetical protein|nr:hypothetical protein [Solirubrobacteraceae bacterium]